MKQVQFVTCAARHTGLTNIFQAATMSSLMESSLPNLVFQIESTLPHFVTHLESIVQYFGRGKRKKDY